MKKLLTLLVIICVATTLFASGFSVNAGGAFDLLSFRTDTVTDSDVYYTAKGNGLGFDLGVQYDFSRKVMAYADFNMIFPSDMEFHDFNGLSTYKSLAERVDYLAKHLTDGNALHSIFLLDASIGAAYRFDLDPIKLAVGGGAYVNILKYKVGVSGKEGNDKVDYKQIYSFLTVGVSTLIDAKYEFTDNIAVRLAVMPQLGIFSKRDIDFYYNGIKDESESRSLSGVGICFTMPITIGASYSF